MARQSPTVRAAWIAGFFGVVAAIIVGASGFLGPGPAEDANSPIGAGGAGNGVEGPRTRTSGDQSPAMSGERNVVGDRNVVIDHVGGSVTVNPAPKTITKKMLSPTPVFRAVQAGENAGQILDPANLLGNVSADVEIRVVPDSVVETGDVLLPSFTRVEILSGEHKGKAGWVRSSAISEVKVAE